MMIAPRARRAASSAAARRARRARVRRVSFSAARAQTPRGSVIPGEDTLTAQSLDDGRIVLERTEKEGGTQSWPLEATDTLRVSACLAWLVDDHSANADTAFRHGLAVLANGEKKQERGADALAQAVELLKRVEPQRIRSALSRNRDEESDVVAIAVLLSPFFPSA